MRLQTVLNALAVLLLLQVSMARDPYADEPAVLRRPPPGSAQASEKRKPGVARTSVYRNALPQSLFDKMEAECRAISAWEKGLDTLLNDKKRTRWLPIEDPPRTILEEAVVRLAKLANVKNAIGYEWWTQVVGSGDPIGFHVDKDESVASNKHYLLHPLSSSVFYITDIGGSTLIPDQWSPKGSGYDPVDPEEGEIIYPERNKFMLFDGTLLHGVVPGPRLEGPPRERITFLINFWDVKPEAPNCELLPHINIPGLTMLTKKKLKALRAELDAETAAADPPRGQATDTQVLDLTPGSSTPFYKHTIRLPGGDTETVRLPQNPAQGASYTLIWKRTSSNSNKLGNASTQADLGQVGGSASASSGDDSSSDSDNNDGSLKNKKKSKKKKGKKSKKRQSKQADADEDSKADNAEQNAASKPDDSSETVPSDYEDEKLRFLQREKEQFDKPLTKKERRKRKAKKRRDAERAARDSSASHDEL